MSVDSLNCNNQNTQKRQQQIEALNVLPSVVIGGVLLAPCPFEHKISPISNFLSQRQVLKHFQEKNSLKSDTFNRISKELGEDTVNFVKNNKKINWKPILSKTAIVGGIVAGTYIISNILINHLKNKNSQT